MSFNPDKIWQRREEIGLSLIELAQLTGISIGGLHYIETGKKIPRVDTLLKIARALKCPISYFFDEEENLLRKLEIRGIPESVKKFIKEVSAGKTDMWTIRDLTKIKGLEHFEARRLI